MSKIGGDEKGKEEERKEKGRLSLCLSLSQTQTHRRRHSGAPQRHADIRREPDNCFPLRDVPGRNRASQGARRRAPSSPPPSSLLLALCCSCLLCRGRFGAGRGVGDEADADVGVPSRRADPGDESGSGRVGVIFGGRLLLLGVRDREEKDQEQEEEGAKGTVVIMVDRHRFRSIEKRVSSFSLSPALLLVLLTASRGGDKRG